MSNETISDIVDDLLDRSERIYEWKTYRWNHSEISAELENIAVRIENAVARKAVAPGELKSCPFCGDSPVMRRGDRYGFWAVCPKCGATVSLAETEADAVARWNNRKGCKP